MAQLITYIPTGEFDTDGSPILEIHTVEEIESNFQQVTPMKIRRKPGLEIEGYPNGVIYVKPSIVDFQKQELEIKLGFYESQEEYENGAESIFDLPSFMFNKDNTPPDINPMNAVAVITAILTNAPDKWETLKTINFGKGDFIEIQKHLDFKQYFNPITLVGKLWIMEQLDHEGIPFRENWILANGEEFQYEASLVNLLMT